MDKLLIIFAREVLAGALGGFIVILGFVAFDYIKRRWF